jgi:flagellar hook-associated protein 1 FlgK
MTGRNTGLIATDVIGFTGEMTFAALDSSDNYASRVVVDFDAMTINNGGSVVAIGGTGSIGNFVTAMNGASGFAGAATLVFSGGQLTFAVGTAAGVGTIQDASDPSLRGGRGFSHFFGLNDLVEAVEPPHFDTGLTAASTHSLIAGKTTTLQFRGPENQVAVSFDLTTTNINLRGTTLQSVLDELNATTAMGNYVTFSLDSAGAMVVTPAAGFAGYSVVATSDTSARGNSNQSLTDLFGLGDKYIMDAARTVKVIDAITTAPVKMALGQLDISAAAIAGTIPAVSVGDNRGAVGLHQTANVTVNFSAAGGLAAVSSTLSDYAGSVISDVANSGAIVEQLGMDRTAYEDEIRARVSDLSGVNIDEEMANMILFQNAFSAAARIIAVVQAMFDDLLRVV